MNYWERQRTKVLAKAITVFSVVVFILLIALPASASYNVFYAGTNFNTVSFPQYGEKVRVDSIYYSNSYDTARSEMFTCGLTTDPYPAGFWVSNMLSGRYLFTVQNVPHLTPRIFVIPDGSGNYTLSTADVVATAAGTGFPSYADITNYVNTHAGSLGASYISNSFGIGTNTMFFNRTTTDTNTFHVYGAGDSLANGNYFIAAHMAGPQLTVYTNENKSGYAFARGVENVGCSDANYAVYNGTNGDQCAAAWTLLYFTSATNVAWTVAAGGTSPAPTLAGWGQFYPAITVAGSLIGDGSGLTNINASANGLSTNGGLAGTLSNKFIHVRDGAVGAGITINNTNWIQSGGVSGGMATITNGGTTVYSTNGAFANVKMFDQILFPAATPSAVQVLALVVSPNAVFGFQLNIPEPTIFSSTATYTSNWFLIPAMFRLTDYSVGGENRVMAADANNSFHFIGIGNQGVVAFHHFQNGTMSGMGISTVALSGLQMGPNGVYYEIFGAGSNFVNGGQFVLPAETLREAQVFLTNGMVDFQYGFTNRAALPIKFAMPILPLAGIYGGVITNNATGLNINGQLSANVIINNAGGGIQGTFVGDGSAVTNLPAQTNSNTALLDRNPQTWTGSNHIAGAFEGSGILVTNLNASQLATGTVPSARLSLTSNDIPLLDAKKLVTGVLNAAQAGSITQHSDVKIIGSAPTIRDMLIWDGTNWTNAPSMGYTIDLFDTANNSMAANTTYYYGKMSSRLINTSYGIAQIDIPRAGRITRVQYKDDISATLGSGEVVNFWIEVNNATDVFNWQFAMTAAFTNNVVTGSQAVAVGDTIVFKVTTPATWATPATSVRLAAQVYIEP